MGDGAGVRRREFLRAGSAVGLSGLVGCLGRDPAIESVSFVHHITEERFASTDDTVPPEQRYRLVDDGVSWDATPAEFVVGDSTIPSALDADSVVDAVDAAFATWNGVSGVDPVFDVTHDDELGEATQGNDVNELVWAQLDEQNILGRANLRWDTADDTLVEVTIRLNAGVSWTTTPDEQTDRFDVQNTVTHELGHNGLADVTDYPEQTMYHLTEPGETRKRSLGAGDVAGWQLLYG